MPCCCGCGRPAPSDVAHSNWGEHGKCKGKKADDKYTIPLNRVCHQKFDQYKMGMDRQESRVWFLERLSQTNLTLKWLEREQEQNGVDF